MEKQTPSEVQAGLKPLPLLVSGALVGAAGGALVWLWSTHGTAVFLQLGNAMLAWCM